MDLHRLTPVLVLPLRPFGLDPGRALANAQPSDEQRADRRREQLLYIESHFPRPDTTAPISVSR
jgi:hypothetical protein